MINDPNAHISQSLKTATASAENKPSTETPYRGGIGGLNSRLHLGNQRGRQQDAARNVFDALSQIAQAGNYGAIGEIRFHQLDNSVSNVALSGTVLSLEIPEKRKVITSLLLVEGSEITRIKPFRVDGRDGTSLELERPATDLYDNDTSAAVRELIYSFYVGDNIDVVDVGANIVPKTVTSGKSVADLVASDEMANILFFAVNNLASGLIDITGNKERLFSVTWATEDRTARIRANIDLNPAPVFTAAHHPVRSDVSITIGAYANENGNNAKFNTASDITKVDAYVDLVYVDKVIAASEESARTGRPVDPNTIYQTYAPRVIITRADSLASLVTPELSLLAITSTLALSRDNTWIGLFKPRYGIKPGKKDLRDIGAIGFEATHLTNGVSARIDVKSDDFNSNPGHLVELINTALHPNLSYSQDILECSDLGAIDSIWLSAAIGTPSAIQRVIHHADNLTAGRFSTAWNNNQQIATYANALIPMGYYTAEDGTQVDLRTIDYLAMLNMYGQEDLLLVEKFANQTDRADNEVYYRASVLKEILTSALGSSVVVTGFAHRINWNPLFLTTLAHAISDAGFTVESNSVGIYSGNTSRRGDASVLSNGVQFNSANSFYSYGNNGQRTSYQRPQIHNPYLGNNR